MSVDPNRVEIEALALLEVGLDDQLLEAFARHEADNPQYGAEWLHNLALYALAGHEQAVVYVARLGTDDFVALPLKIDARSGHASSLGNFYTSAYSPVVCTRHPEPLFTALFNYLARCSNVTTLTLSPMVVDPPLLHQLSAALEQSLWLGVHKYFCFGNWTLELESSSYQAYLSTRPSQLRNTIKRRTRQFLGDGRGTLEVIRGDALQIQHIDLFTSVYGQSWKQDEPYPNFIPGLLRLAARRGWLRLGIARYDNTDVASQIWLVCGDTAYIFKLAYHEDHKHLSPGTVLTAHLMEYVLDRDSVSRVDFLSGDDKFKQQWMSTRRECWGLAAYNPRSLRGVILYAGYALKSQAKKYLRSREPAAST